MMFVIIILMIVMIIMAMRERGNKLGRATFITHHSREREFERERERERELIQLMLCTQNE